jgi:Ca2+-binding EF-hand superfamily protein
MNNVRDMFAKALRDQLTAQERATFEAALADPALAREFEAFADAEAGGDLENVTAWLEHAGRTPFAGTYAPLTREVLRRVQPRKRGRLVPLIGALATAAAAAAIIVIMNVHTSVVAPEPWPENTPGQVSMMDGGHRYFEAELEDFHPAEGVVLNIGKESLVLPGDHDARLVKGVLRVKTDEDARYSIHIGDNRIEMASAATIEVEADPRQFTETQFTEKDPMFKSRMLAHFGASSFAFTLTVMTGSVTLHAAHGTRLLTAPQTIQAEANPPHAKPPKIEDVFAHLDGNSDGKLDDTEVPQHMIDDFDDDASGDIDVDEFKAHHKPPKPNAKPEDLFAEMDKNSDGKLDDVEVPQKLIEEMDDDASGDINLDEFKTHHKPMAPAGAPKAEDHFAHLDVNSDGKLDDSELPDDMLDELDGDADGKVTLDEFKANHKPPQPPKPQKPEDEFAKLDANSDGAIDDTETEQKMIDDFDDDASGDVDLDEFKQHWRPRPMKPEDAFAGLDKNSDGNLDDEELPKAIVNDWDDDDSGEVDLEEFKAHQKPMAPAGPGQPGGPGRGPGGPGKGHNPPKGPGPK